MGNVSERLLVHIRESEGLRLNAYRDAAGVWTIGYGHTANVRRGDKISKTTAEMYLQEDLSPIITQLRGYRQIKTQGQLDALADFAFNVGMGKLRKSTLWKLVLRAAPASDVQQEFKKWVYAGRKRLDGLVKRREWEARVYAEI